MRLNRLILTERLQRAGVPGVLGLGLAAFAAVAGLSAFLPARQQLAETRLAVEQARAALRPPEGGEAPRSEQEQLARFYAAFPARDRAPELLERVYRAAEESGLEVVRGEYTVSEDRKSGLVSYRVLLPLRGQYAQIRGFIDAALEAVPTLAVDQLDFARERISESRLDAQVRFNLYLARL